MCLARFLSSFVFVAALLVAQTPLSGTLSDGAGGPIGPGVYHCGEISVAQGTTLTIQAGAILKFNGAVGISVGGHLVVGGTASQRVIFTSLQDDSAGGDTNGNGPSSGAFAQWRNIAVFGPGQMTASNFDVRWTGTSFQAAMNIVGNAVVTLTNGLFTNATSTADGIICTGIGSTLNVTGCHVTGFRRPVYNIPPEVVPGFHGNTASGNVLHNGLELANLSLTGNATWSPDNMISNAIITSSDLTVPAGSTLTLMPGVIVKLPGAVVNVFGTLLSLGTQAMPVTFTGIDDDAIGGDVRGNGPTTANPGSWRNLVFHGGSIQSRMIHTAIRFGGSPGPMVICADDVVIENCTLHGSFDKSFFVSGGGVKPHLIRSTISGTTFPFGGLRLSSCMNFVDNVVTGNSFNRLDIVDPVVSPGTIVQKHNFPDGVAVLGIALDFQASSSLEIGPGVVFKVAGFMHVDEGRIDIRGTARDPVVFTSQADDAFGGDTNGNGPTTATPGGWNGVTFGSSADPTSSIEHLVIRGAGGGGAQGFQVSTPISRVDSLQVDTCVATGVAIYGGLAAAHDWLIYGCARGIQIFGGQTSIRHATITACSFYGIENLTTWNGEIRNSIVTGNVFGDVIGVAPAQIHATNGATGAVGMNGNINLSPMFVDAGSRDYRLTSASPCIDAADTGIAHLTRNDKDDGSRLVDSTLTGQTLPDMGCYERRVWDLAVAGEPALGTSMSFTVQGPASGLAALLLAGANGSRRFYPDYGYLLIGDETDIVVGAFVQPGFPVNFTLPTLPQVIGFPFQVQAIVVSGFDTTKGHFTQRYRGTVRP